MEIKIEGNPGTGNTFQEIKIQHVENFNPNATTVTVNHNHYGDKNAKLTTHHSQPSEIDITPIRTEILNYVSCLRPLLKDEWKSNYMKLWEDILNLDVIADAVYNAGKQQDTNFNRALVANIIHYLGGRNIFKDAYSPTAMVMALEGDKDHTVRGPLAKDPSDNIVSRLDRFLETFAL